MICYGRSFCLNAFAVIVQLLGRIWHFTTPWTGACQASLSFTTSWSLFKFMSIESVMPSNHLILCHPLLLLPSVFPSIRVFSNGSALHIRWPEYWSFSSSISPSNEYSGLISFRMDWFDLLAVQGTLKSLLQQAECKQVCFKITREYLQTTRQRLGEEESGRGFWRNWHASEVAIAIQSFWVFMCSGERRVSTV